MAVCLEEYTEDLSDILFKCRQKKLFEIVTVDNRRQGKRIRKELDTIYIIATKVKRYDYIFLRYVPSFSSCAGLLFLYTCRLLRSFPTLLISM